MVSSSKISLPPILAISRAGMIYLLFLRRHAHANRGLRISGTNQKLVQYKASILACLRDAFGLITSLRQQTESPKASFFPTLPSPLSLTPPLPLSLTTFALLFFPSLSSFLSHYSHSLSSPSLTFAGASFATASPPGQPGWVWYRM